MARLCFRDGDLARGPAVTDGGDAGLQGQTRVDHAPDGGDGDAVVLDLPEEVGGAVVAEMDVEESGDEAEAEEETTRFIEEVRGGV